VSSLILRTATRLLMPILLLFAIFLLTRGHNAPGGGFVGGLVVSAAFVLHATAYGVAASRRALIIDTQRLLGIGLFVALGSALVTAPAGRPFMTAAWLTIGPHDSGLALGTPLVFDVGVFLAVIGVVLTIVFSLVEAVASGDE
jgi:multicomponent Na+:H+ antiporter subunit B